MKDNSARLVLASLLRAPQKAALGDLDHCLSRAALLANISAQSEMLIAEGVKPDDFLVLTCDRGLAFWIELMASWIVGAKPICVESKISDEHAVALLKMTKAGSILGYVEETSTALSKLKRLSSTFDPTAQSQDLLTDFNNLPFVSDNDMPDMAGLIFTSGTTGLPKGVPLTHRALNANALATSQRLRLRSDDRLMIATPFRFISSISHFLVTLISDAAFFGLEKPMMIKDLLNAMNNLEISAFGGSPFHTQFIAMAGEERLPHLRWVMSSGDHLRPAVIDQLEQTFKELELHVVYGMAELGGRFCELPPENQFSKKGSVGYPINGFEFTIRDEEGNICPPGEIGNIFVGGLLEFEGYFSAPKTNAEVLGPYGFANGDKGYLDDDGYLFLSGRSDAVFKRSGLKVSAQVVSDAMMSLDAVKDVFVSSEEDPMEGRVPVAHVCWHEGQEMDRSNATQALRNLLPVNHLPKRFISLPVIPRTGSGKVDRRELNALVEKTLNQG